MSEWRRRTHGTDKQIGKAFRVKLVKCQILDVALKAWIFIEEDTDMAYDTKSS